MAEVTICNEISYCTNLSRRFRAYLSEGSERERESYRALDDATNWQIGGYCPKPIFNVIGLLE